MKTAEEMYAYARENKLGKNITPLLGGWLQKKHFRLIESALAKDEEAVSAFIGRHRSEDRDTITKKEAETQEEYMSRIAHTQTGKVRYFDCKGFTAYAITSSGRLIFARWFPFNNDYKSVPLSNINTVNPNTHIIWGSLRIESFREVFSIFWTKRVVFAIAKLLEEGKSDIQDGVMDGITAASLRKKHLQELRDTPPSSQQPLTTETNYEKLKERKKALDDGLITQAEYDEYRAKFLDN